MLSAAPVLAAAATIRATCLANEGQWLAFEVEAAAEVAEAAAGAEVIPVAGSIAERWRGLVEDGYGRQDISAARMGLGLQLIGA